MCTTAANSPRPCDRCDSGIATGTGTKDAHGQFEFLCAGCAARLLKPEYKAESADTDFVPYEADAEYATGYEADVSPAESVADYSDNTLLNAWWESFSPATA